MRDFICPNCGQRLAFENSLCLSCKQPLGFSLEDMALLVIASGEESAQPGFVDAEKYELCANLHLAECNWLVENRPDRTAVHIVCADPDPAQRHRHRGASRRSPSAERAKRRLIAELFELKLPIVGRDEDPDYGLAFDLLSSEQEKVFTGHENGVITLDLAEGDDVHREQLRIAMDEPYRTLLGHFRHEIGHYYYYRLVEHVARLHAAVPRTVSATPMPTTRRRWTATTSNGPPADWKENYVSSYATMHPAEDWAETFAHYLHIRDTLDTAAAFSIAPAAATFERRVLGPSGFDQIIDMWLPLSWALNMLNRSMGKQDLYPFVLPPAVLEKMRFIHTVVDEVTAG